MVSKKLLFFVGLLFVGFSCQAMESDIFEQLKGNITMRCSDGKMGLPKELAEQAKTVASFLELEEGASDSVIDLESLGLNRETVFRVFDCVRNKRTIKNLKPDEVNTLFEAADALGVPQWVLRKLTLQGKKLLPKDVQHEKIACGHYLNSIRSLYNEGKLKDILEIKEYHDEYNLVIKSTLNLCNNELDSLQGIELLGKKYDKVFVTMLNIENNTLQKLDVMQLLKVFPWLQGIRAYNNHIEELLVPEKLPHGFFLHLQKNRIKELPIFKTGELSVINLTGNQLSKQARVIALCAAQPTLLEGQWHRIKALRDKQMWYDMLQVSGGSVGVGVIGGTLFAGLYLTIKKIIYPEIDLVADLLERLQRLIKDRSFLFQLGGTSFFGGLLIGGLYYHKIGYNNNLVHQFKAGTVFLDKDTKE